MTKNEIRLIIAEVIAEYANQCRWLNDDLATEAERLVDRCKVDVIFEKKEQGVNGNYWYSMNCPIHGKKRRM